MQNIFWRIINFYFSSNLNLKYVFILCDTNFIDHNSPKSKTSTINSIGLQFQKTCHKFQVVTQLAQRRCDNVVTSSWLTLSQSCDKVENEICGDVSFLRCDNFVVQRCYNVSTISTNGCVGAF